MTSCTSRWHPLYSYTDSSMHNPIFCHTPIVRDIHLNSRVIDTNIVVALFPFNCMKVCIREYTPHTATTLLTELVDRMRLRVWTLFWAWPPYALARSLHLHECTGAIAGVQETARSPVALSCIWQCIWWSDFLFTSSRLSGD